MQVSSVSLLGPVNWASLLSSVSLISFVSHEFYYVFSLGQQANLAYKTAALVHCIVQKESYKSLPLGSFLECIRRQTALRQKSLACPGTFCTRRQAT